MLLPTRQLLRFFSPHSSGRAIHFLLYPKGVTDGFHLIGAESPLASLSSSRGLSERGLYLGCPYHLLGEQPQDEPVGELVLLLHAPQEIAVLTRDGAHLLVDVLQDYTDF